MRNLSHVVQSGLAVVSTTQMSLPNLYIPLPLKFVDQHLLDSRLVAPTLSNLIQPPWYNSETRCEYHGGVLVHFNSIVAKISRIEFEGG